MSDHPLPFRNNEFVSELRQGYKQQVSNFTEDLAQVYELRVKVDRANREFKEGIGRQIDQLMLTHPEILQEADAVGAGDSLLLTAEDITTLFLRLGTRFVPGHWVARVIENIRENDKLKAQEKMVRSRYLELYNQKGRPRMTRNHGHYTRRMDWYARRLFSRQDAAQDRPMPVKIVKRLEFLKLYGEKDVSETDFEQDLSARTSFLLI
ncbi:hypothetical protein F52700_856 [Fusarium sp. NRRL 52700]|nr:hypothetical protein F52700_856 [Fusarium sp. NRRL 52700]